MLLRLTPILLVSWRPTTCQWEIWHLIIPHQTIPFMNGRRLLKLLGASITSALIAASGLLPINTHAAAQRIAWVSFHPADNTPSGAAAAAGFTQAPDVEYTRLLAAAGHTVTRIVTSASPDTTLLNGFDLVIISRSVPSSHYQTDPSPGLWNGITKPTIILGGYILRASRLGYTIGDTMVDTGGEIRLGTTNPSHPIFTGVDLDAGGVMVNPYANRVTYNGTLQAGISVNNDEPTFGAEVLATVATDTDPTFGGFIIAELPAGTVMSNGTGDTLGGKRLVLLTGSRESGITSEAAGIWDLTTDGARLFLNAVHYMTGQPLTEPPPVISDIRPASGTKQHLADLGLSFAAGSGTAAGIPEANITLSLNGTNVPASQLFISGTAQARTVAFSNLVAGVNYTGTITVRDAGGREATQTFTFDTLDPISLPASFAYPTSAAVASSSGMKVRIVQATSSPTLPNTSDRAEQQLAGTLIDPLTGEPFLNEAIPSTDNPDGAYNMEFLNLSVESGLALERGNFRDPEFPDQPFPGLAHNNNIAVEVLAYLELQPGRYYMGVNSDDGFVVYAGPNARDLFAMDLGRYDGGRGSADSIFQFLVTEAGLYPFRLVYYQGDGGGNLEWFTMNPLTGEKILINDPVNPNAVNAYRQINVPERPFISALAPARNQINTPISSNIVITVEEPGATVQQNSVQLRVNGQTVAAPQITKAGSTTTITYDPAQDLPSDTVIPVELTFTDSASNQRTVNYSFTTEFVPPVVDGANIVWVSFHPGDDEPSGGAAAFTNAAPDKGYTELLRAAGHTVTRYVTTGAPDTAYLQTFDLVIISRSNPSGNFQSADSTTAWHSLTNPVIHLGGYTLRANRLGLYAGDGIPDTGTAPVVLNVKDPNHPIFAGIDLTGNSNTVNAFATLVPGQRGISVNNSPIIPGGTVLASVATPGDPALNGTIISEFPAGTTMGNTAQNVSAGHQLVFLTGSREAGTGSSAEMAGMYDLTGDGAQMFLNAIAYMTGQTPPTPTDVSISATRAENGDLVISWPADATGYVLQGTDSLGTPNWQPVGGTPASNGGQLSQAVPTSGSMRFFRLAKQQ